MSDSTSSVRQWDIFTLSIAGPANDGMYLDETLRATFTQANRGVQVCGFKDGEGRFEVRVMPDSLGAW
jgi:hypothetical protein